MWTLIWRYCSSKSLSITSGLTDIVPPEATDISPTGQTVDFIGHNVPATAVVGLPHSSMVCVGKRGDPGMTFADGVDETALVVRVTAMIIITGNSSRWQHFFFSTCDPLHTADRKGVVPKWDRNVPEQRRGLGKWQVYSVFPNQVQTADG
jgi:hypothetical protein